MSDPPPQSSDGGSTETAKPIEAIDLVEAAAKVLGRDGWGWAAADLHHLIAKMYKYGPDGASSTKPAELLHMTHNAHPFVHTNGHDPSVAPTTAAPAAVPASAAPAGGTQLPAQTPAPSQPAQTAASQQHRSQRRDYTRITTDDKDRVVAAATPAQLATLIVSRNGGRQVPAGTDSFNVTCPNPAHSDSNPSCGVYRGGKRTRYKCRVPDCGVSGDVYNWAELVNLAPSFPERHEELKRLLGLSGSLPAAPAVQPAPPAAPPPEKTDEQWATKMERDRLRVDNDLVVVRYARQLRLPEEMLTARQVHAASRQLSAADGTFPVVKVARHPVFDVAGQLAGWQDRLSRQDADRHCGGITKRSAQGMRQPLIGAHRLPGAKVVLLCEGLSDWLTADVGLERSGKGNWVAVGMLGAARHEAAVRLIAQHVDPSAELLVIPDRDSAGDAAFAKADRTWWEMRGKRAVAVRVPVATNDLAGCYQAATHVTVDDLGVAVAGLLGSRMAQHADGHMETALVLTGAGSATSRTTPVAPTVGDAAGNPPTSDGAPVQPVAPASEPAAASATTAGSADNLPEAPPEPGWDDDSAPAEVDVDGLNELPGSEERPWENDEPPTD